MDTTKANGPAQLNRWPMIVGVAGGSAGGKTTLAQAMADEAGSATATILELDRFYHPKALSPQERITNFDEPRAIDFELLSSVMGQLNQRGQATVPVYDFSSHDRVGQEPFKATRLIVVEGILALWDDEIRSAFNYRIYVDAPDALRLERRITRDVAQRGRQEEDVRAQWLQTVLPMHRQYVEPTRSHADQVVDGRSDLHQVARTLLHEFGL
ncbi:MAG: uridine kinase family protein [Rubripirellula sp.]